MLRGKFRAFAVIFAFGTVMFAVSPAMAQRGPSPERTDKHIALLKEKLNLTDSQAEKIKTIMEDSRKEAMSQREKHKGDPEATAKFREEHRRATDEKIKAVLNDDQKKEYDKIKDEFRKNMQERRQKRDMDRMGPGSGHGPGGRR
ncbi:MAG: hypothetical protein A2W25_10120 [candidate division Zixibacteria bacterium RBG_16_53_22]|nr:MAG: hypothetical protein A2W25_10120 [candidate division Zixibacteria bacterium RBG_16_53_22]